MERSEDMPPPRRVMRAAMAALRSVGMITTLVVAGILAAAVAAFLLQVRHEKDAELVLTRDASAVAAAAQVETSSAFRRVKDVASFMAVAGIPSQSNYERYLQEADVIGQDWLEEMVFIQPVRRDQLNEFVAKERRESGRRVNLRLGPAQRDGHWLVSRTLAGQKRAIGLDVKNIPGVDGPLIEAMRTDRERYTRISPAAAGLLNVFLNKPGVVASGPDVLTGVIPVRYGASNTRLGWLLVQIRVSKLVRTADLASLETHLRLLTPRRPGDVVAFSLDGQEPKDPPADSFVSSFDQGQMGWQMSVWSHERPGLSGHAIVVLVLGILASLTLGLLGTAQRRANRAREALLRSEQDRRRDDLTGLPNRVGLGEALEETLAQPSTTAVLFCDLDRFKVINDSLGHQAGDQLLKVVGKRLRASIRQDDVVGRFGGDEFVVICKNLNEGKEAEHVAERVLSTVAAPLKLEGTEVEVNVSIGIAVSSADEPRTCHELLRDADVAMYAAKKARTGQRAFDGALRRDAMDRLDIEGALRSTLKDDLLRVEYQPVVASVGHRLVALEALARFDDPILTAAGPQRVIPVAEEIGLVGALGEKVLMSACEQMVAWNGLRPDAPPLQVSVNVSETQLRDANFVGLVRKTILTSGLAPDQLILELPESAITRNMQLAMNVFLELDEIGVQVSIDDFGSGRSSLTEMIRFTTIDELKLDRSLVSRATAPSVRALLISAVTEIARGLNARLVAVGVETQEQLATVNSSGVERAQGFLFAKSLRPSELSEIVADSEHKIRPQLHSEFAHVAAPTMDF